MHQPLRLQKIQHPVHGRRRRGGVFIAQLIQDVVGLDRLMIAPDQFQHALPEPGETLAGGVTQASGHLYGRIKAILMPVRGGLEGPYYRIFIQVSLPY